MSEYSQNKPLYYFKVILQWVLVGMIWYSCHLALRDSDQTTFTNRLRESMKFVQGNHPGYRIYMFDNMGIDRKNCTAGYIDNLVDIAPLATTNYAQAGVLVSTAVLLNSRMGNILALF